MYRLIDSHKVIRTVRNQEQLLSVFLQHLEVVPELRLIFQIGLRILEHNLVHGGMNALNAFLFSRIQGSIGKTVISTVRERNLP